MKLFLSRYVNKVDRNGRVSVPAAYRAVLKDQGFCGVVVYLSFANKCIEACSMKKIEELSNLIEKMDEFSDERNAFSLALLGGSLHLPFDSEGRIVLNSDFMKAVGIHDKAAFVGKGKTFEIWNPDDLDLAVSDARKLSLQRRSVLNERVL